MSAGQHPAPAFTIAPDALEDERVLALLSLHLAEMHANSPACKVHAMPAQRLRSPDVSFYAAWAGEELAAVGALKTLGAQRGELKSMRAAENWRGKGAGEALLLHLMTQARARGINWLGLETGQGPAFEPAHGLYRKHGFAPCPAFGDYKNDDFSICLSRKL